MSPSNNNREKKKIEELKKENRRLRAELSKLRSHHSPTPKEATKQERLFASKCRSAELVSSNSYFSYLKDKLLTAPLYSEWKRILSYFRRVRLISTVIKVAAAILTVVGTGAFFIVVSGTLLVFIPFASLFLAFFYLAGITRRKKHFAKLEIMLRSRNIYVFFPPKGRPFENGSCFSETVRIISNDTKKDNFVIIVSPYFLSPKGVEGSSARYYHVLRYDSSNVCIIRKNAFFALRKRVLSKLSADVIYVY